MMIFLRRFWFILLAAFFLGVLFVFGFRHYEGSKLLYVVFSFVSTGLLFSGLYRSISFGYLFLSIFLWLGFWFKLSVNYLIFSFFPFGEPVGGFDSSSQAWDLVLMVATIGCLGVLVGRGICGIFWRERFTEWSWGQGPKWYPSVRKYAWCAVIAAILITTAINTFFGVHQIGISPQTIFPWPTNALIAWFLNVGAALSISVLICWDFGLRRQIGLQTYAILGEAFITTISIISRATFPFHVISQLVALFGKRSIREQFTWRQVLIYLITLVILFIVSIGAVSILRDHYYVDSKSKPIIMSRAKISEAPVQSNTVIINSSESVEVPVKTVSSFRWILIHQLAVNRWIGIEGLMAISSHEGKNMFLLLNMLLEKREIGKAAGYQAISKSGYQDPDSKYQFASMPGIIGFLFYSGSLYVVFVAMLLVVVFMVASERAVLMLTVNPMFCSIYGMVLANYIAQFGLAPRQDLPQFAMLYSMAAIIWLIRFISRK